MYHQSLNLTFMQYMKNEKEVFAFSSNYFHATISKKPALSRLTPKEVTDKVSSTSAENSSIK